MLTLVTLWFNPTFNPGLIVFIAAFDVLLFTLLIVNVCSTLRVKYANQQPITNNHTTVRCSCRGKCNRFHGQGGTK